MRNRANGSNTVNEHSSRSHSVLTLNIDSEIYDEEDEKLCMTRHGKLAFVDLAGAPPSVAILFIYLKSISYTKYTRKKENVQNRHH